MGGILFEYGVLCLALLPIGPYFKDESFAFGFCLCGSKSEIDFFEVNLSIFCPKNFFRKNSHQKPNDNIVNDAYQAA